MLALHETGRPPRNRTEFPGLKDRCIGHECLQPVSLGASPPVPHGLCRVSISSLRSEIVGGWASPILSAHRLSAPAIATRWTLLLLAARPHATPTASGAHLRPLPDGIPEDAETGHARWSRTTCLPVCSRPSALRTVSSCVIWRPQRGSNPHSQIDNLVSWPLDDESSWRARGRRSRRAALLGRREQRR